MPNLLPTIMQPSGREPGESRSWSVAGIDGVECFRADGFVRQYPRHSHESFSIGAVGSGIGGTTFRGSSHRIPAGSLILINPDEAHTGWPGSREPLSYCMLYLRAEVMQSLSRRPSRKPHFRKLWIQDDFLARRVTRLCDFLESEGTLLAKQTRLIETIEAVARRTAAFDTTEPVAKEPKAVALMKEYLRERSAENVGIDELASLTDLNRAHLIRLFRRTVGLPPHAWLLQIRIARARELLAQGVPLAETALRTGFCDQSHLTRYFRSFLGVTPGQFRKGHYHSRFRAAHW